MEPTQQITVNSVVHLLEI